MPHCHPRHQELVEAYRALFGPRASFPVKFPQALLPSEIKAAYRQRALETHPDRLQAKESDAGTGHEEFLRVCTAYRILSEALSGGRLPFADRTAGHGKGNHKASRSCTTAAATQKRMFKDRQLPCRELLFGQFLYYARVITWEELIQAIVWQRRQRPRIGQIALGWNMLSSDEIHTLLREKRRQERFGETALRKGWLSRHNLLALLGRQRLMNLAIGRYFVDKELLTQSQVDTLANRQRLHNRHYRCCR